jgi:hypothetical protein
VASRYSQPARVNASAAKPADQNFVTDLAILL